MSPEKALIVSKARLAKLSATDFPGLGALYCGDEFCPAKMPGAGALQTAARRFPGKRLALLTPMLTRESLGSALKTISLATAQGSIEEVVVNDIGLLYRLAGNFGGKLKITVGRVLVYTLKFSLRSGFFGRFSRKYGIDTFEADSEESLGYLPLGKTSRNLHLPYAYLAHTRFCPVIKNFSASCAGRCGERASPLESPLVGKMFLKGNAYLRDNSGDLPRLLQKAGHGRVKRLVFTGIVS